MIPMAGLSGGAVQGGKSSANFILRVVYGRAAQKIWGSCITTWSETSQGTPQRRIHRCRRLRHAPRGRSALILAGSLAEMRRVLIPNTSTTGPSAGRSRGRGSRFWKAHQERVHRSLTRHIYVCRWGRNRH